MNLREKVGTPFLKNLPYLFLFMVTVIQMKPINQMPAIKDSLKDIVTNREETYLTVRNSSSNPDYIFAQGTSDIIPNGSKIAFFSLTVPEEEYYRIRFWMKPNISASYFVLDNITGLERTITSQMKVSGIKYLILSDLRGVTFIKRPILKALTGKAENLTILFKLNGDRLERIYYK